MELGLRDDEATADGVEDVGGEQVVLAVEGGEAKSVGVGCGPWFGLGISGLELLMEGGGDLVFGDGA